MDNRNRDKGSDQNQSSINSGDVSRKVSPSPEKPDRDANASFGQNTGQSEDLGEPSRKGGESSWSDNLQKSGSELRDSGSDGMNSSPGRSGSSGSMRGGSSHSIDSNDEYDKGDRNSSSKGSRENGRH
jgi:hypothetical protein